jgi:quinol monooxygenase YgiN
MSKQAGGRVVLVTFKTRQGQDKELASRMLSLIPATRAEPGNRQFEFYADQDDPLHFMLYAEFTDDAARQAHLARPEMVAALRDIEPLLQHPPDASSWTLALTNARANGGTQTPAGHVTLVRFRMKADSVERMLSEIGGDLDHMQGNIRFDLNRSCKDPLEYMICARWVSRPIWEAHNAKPEFKSFAERTRAFLDSPMQRVLWKPPA